MANVLKPKRGKATTLATLNPLLENGEICLEIPDTGAGSGRGRIKVGDGVHNWNDLEYFVDFEDTSKFISINDVGVPGGVVPLNNSRLIDSKFLPSYLDEVLEFPTFNDFPEIGSTGKIYIDKSKSTDNVYRWGGTAYFLISKAIQYSLEKNGGAVVLKGTDGSSSTVSSIGGIEIRANDPSASELYLGKMWLVTK